MMDSETIRKYNHFRSLCLQNAEQALNSAETLFRTGANHIVFHLIVLSLEEMGKIFVGWMNLSAKDEWGKETFNYRIDDHVKKLFWVIWWPTLLKEKISNQQIDEIRNVASLIHNKRLESLYTHFEDVTPGSQKISNAQIEFYLKLARQRLAYAKTHGDEGDNPNDEKASDLLWFDSACDDPTKSGFIFSEISFNKLHEYGNSKDWIHWLQSTFDEERKHLDTLLKQELNRPKQAGDKGKQKWKVRIPIVTPSHSIRNNILLEFNKTNELLKLSKGRDVHTLHIDLFFSAKTSINELWHGAWLNARLLVAALNVGTNGVFYWNVPLDVDKFYDAIWDLENKKQVLARLSPGLQFDWSEKKMFLSRLNLDLTVKAYYYFSSCLGQTIFEPVNLYMHALGQSAKIDIHLRLERESFIHFFLSFKQALILNENYQDDVDIKSAGLKQIGGVLKNTTEFENMIDLGIRILNDFHAPVQITIKEVMAMKLYCNFYFVTLALRKIQNSKDIFLTRLD